MSTHINTINAIKGLTCVANSLIPAIDLKPTARLMGDHVRKHLTDAGIEIERLNNEITHLRNYASRLNENFSVIHSDRSLLMAAVRKTRAGAQAITGINYQSVADAVAAIEVTEDERKWRDIHWQLMALIHTRTLVIYNIDFDVRLIMQTMEINNCGFAYLELNAECAMRNYAEYYGQRDEKRNKFKWQSLSNAAKQQGVVIDGTPHRALSDCKTTLGIIRAMAGVK